MDLEPLPPFRYRQPLMDDVEDVENYVPGGYHPVDIGDRISTADGAYQVVHKLGHGGFSTVWLVQSCGSSPSYFALKILRADVTDTTDVELHILQRLKTVAGPGHPNVVALHDSFKVSGPNGEHLCLLFPVLGPSLLTVNISTVVSVPIRQQMCQQAASAMAFLHSHGICHGDLTVSNLAFVIPDIQSMPPHRVSQLLGPIRTENLRLSNGRHSPHAPKKVVQDPDFSGLDYSLISQIRIIDFGQAFLAENPPRSLGVPIDYFPPEVCFGYSPSTKSDVWQLACVLYEMYTGQILFPTAFRIFEILISTIVAYMGPIPQHWRGKYNFDEYGYVEPGKEPKTTDPEIWLKDQNSEKTIEAQLAKDATRLSAHQRKEFSDLIRDMVAYEPRERLSAVDVMRRLESPSFLSED